MSGSPSERDVEFWRRSAIGAAENPLAWRGRAEALWRAAEALLAIHEADVQEHYALLTDASARARSIGVPRQEPVANVCMMLAGLALEALVKGYIVATDANAITSQHGQTALRPKWGGKHVGVPLVALANLPTSPAEDELLDRLGLFVRWGGRYPIPKNAAELRHRHPDQPPASWSSDDVPLIRDLYSRWSEVVTSASYAQAATRNKQRRKAQAARRKELEMELALLPREERDGVAIWHNSAAVAEPGAALGCATCGASVNLDRRHFAMRCRCGILYECVFEWDGLLGRELPIVWDYPPDDA